jgi:hypothetical protein
MGGYSVLIFMQCASLGIRCKNIAIIHMCVCSSCMGVLCYSLVQLNFVI